MGLRPPVRRAGAGLIVRRSVELSVTLLDTAEVYGFGRSERALGEALGQDRASAFIATKILPCCPAGQVCRPAA
jgi:aryl-alcohol dehydrogenase-like predicted oxidoreductase